MAFEILKAFAARRKMEQHVMNLVTDNVYADYGPMRLLFPDGMTEEFRTDMQRSEERIRRAVRRARRDYDGQTLMSAVNHDGLLDAALENEVARLREKWLEVERDRAEVRLRIKAELARLQASRRRLASDLKRAYMEYQKYNGGRKSQNRSETDEE